jgi:subtilisin family serine protease
MCAAALLAGACVAGGDEPSPAAAGKLAPEVLDALRAGETRQLLLVVAAAPAAPAELGDVADGDGLANAGDDRDALALADSHALAHAELQAAAGDARAAARWPAKAALEAQAADLGVAVDDVWTRLPIIPVTVASLADLAPLLEDPRVIAASEVRRFAPSDAESFPLIGQPTALAAGRRGTGTSIAILDSGVAFRRLPFNCVAAGAGACRVAFARDFAPDDGSDDDLGHGSNVAAIASGVAPGARILALDVFDADEMASTTTLLAAYDWVLRNRATYHVAAVNLSLGGGKATRPCGDDPLAVAFQVGRDAGIVTAVAAGNDGEVDAMSWPACAPAAVSVGAVFDAAIGPVTFTGCRDAVSAADRVTCFSNSASFLTLLAPGAMIDGAGYRAAGTSQAAPHVAAAAAVLRAAHPYEKADQLIARLVSGGRLIVDERNGRRTPRLDLPRALGLREGVALRAAPASAHLVTVAD